jgi:long-chain acyl-CoA synthetase
MESEPAVIQLLQDEIDKVNAPLPAWEQIKKYRCLYEALTIEKGELTPKMSIKREVVTGNYRPLMDSLYEE